MLKTQVKKIVQNKSLAKFKKNNLVSIVRADFNVPIKGGKVVDTFRIDSTKRTFDYLISKKSKIIVLDHLGEDGKQSLRPVYNYLKHFYNIEFVVDMDFASLTHTVAQAKPGTIILLENIRRFPGEKSPNLKMQNDLAKNFASLADVYINEAFSVSHRSHMSTAVLPKYLPSYFGFQFIDEVNGLHNALKPKQPFMFLLGGFKFETKLALLKKYKKIASNYFVGGALANNYILAEGYNVGASLVDTDFKIKKADVNDPKLIPIIDVVVKNKSKSRITSLKEVGKNDMIVDIGPATVDLLKTYLVGAKTILWNGPMGLYEQGFTTASVEILKLLADSVKNKKATVIIGGGDTVTLVHKNKMDKAFTFVSTAGGATLDFLAHGTLPGIEAILKSKK